MSKQILVNASHYETRVATLEDGEIRSLHIEREEDRNVVGNIYKGVVKRVLPGIQAAFLELGLERTAFLYVDDIIDEPFGTDVEVVEEEEEDVHSETSDRPIYFGSDDEGDRDRGGYRENRDPRRDGPDGPPQRSHSLPEDDLALENEARKYRGRSQWENVEEDYYEEDDQEEGAPAPYPDEPMDDRGPYPAEPRGGEGGGGSRGGRPPQRRAPRAQRSGGGPRGGMQKKRGGRSSQRRPKGSANIQDLLKEGQEILVQVAKAPIGTKGARLTTHISLPGRNLVLMPTVKHIGISRRIESDKERRRLRDIFSKQIRGAEGAGFILRTVAEGKSLKELSADAEYLLHLWNRIKVDAKEKKAPAMIHEDLSLGMRTVRDSFTDEVDALIVDNPVEFDRIQQFIGQFIPRLKSKVKLFKGPTALFEHYGVEAEISRALGKKVWLKSGGYLLIDQSEALTAIDVNTGRYVGSKSLEETILKTNLEAVKEIAYQLRVRNVGGIIIIDLIDMESLDNREKVFHALQDALGEDRVKTNILKISELGLIEMTRKRTHEDLVRYLTESCTYCEGRGYHKSKRTVCFEIFREIEKESLEGLPNIVVYAHTEVAELMRKSEKEHVKILEKRFQKNIVIKEDKGFHQEQFEVFSKQ